jgi:hypothetical protein
MYYPLNNVGNIVPISNIGALPDLFGRRQDRRARRDLQEQLRDNQRAAAQQMQLQQMLAQQTAQQQLLAQAARGNVNVQAVAPNAGPWAANVPGGPPMLGIPATPPVPTPANGRPVPLAGGVANIAAIVGVTPGTATFTLTTQDPFYLFDMVIQPETAGLSYVESITIGSQNLRAGSTGITGVSDWSATAFNQGKLSGYYLGVSQSFVVVIRNQSTSTNFHVVTLYGFSVR